MKKYAFITILAVMASLTTVNAESLSLEQCTEMARQHNLTLQNAALSIQAAELQQKEAYTKYYPQISANVTAFQAFDDIIRGGITLPQQLAVLGKISPALGQLAGRTYSFGELNRGYAASLSVMIPVYAGGKITTGNKLAALGSEVAVLQQQLKEEDVVQKVTENYWHIAQLSYNLRTIEAAEKQIEAVKQQVENFVNAGVTTRNALLKVNLRSQELASNRLKVENGRKILLLLLAQQIGYEGDDLDIVVPPDTENISLPQQNIDASGRKELMLAQKNVEAQQLQVRMERGKLLPTLAAGVMGYHSGLGGISNIITRFVNTSTTNGLVLATISVPVSDWWGGTYAIRRAKVKAQQAQNEYLDAQQKLFIDNTAAWLNLTEAMKQVDITRASVAEAEENLRISTNHYKAGSETITDLLDAETLCRQAKDGLAATIANYYIRLADYRRKVEGLKN